MGMAAILIKGPWPFEQIFNPPLAEGSRSLKKIGPGVSEKVVQRCGRTDRRRQTASDHNSSSWAFGSSELTIGTPDDRFSRHEVHIQSTLVISNSKGLSEILRYICTSTYQICRIEEKSVRTTTFNKYICNWTLEFRDILKILWKRGEIAPKELRSNFSSFPQYFFTCFRFDFHV